MFAEEVEKLNAWLGIWETEIYLFCCCELGWTNRTLKLLVRFLNIYIICLCRCLEGAEFVHISDAVSHK